MGKRIKQICTPIAVVAALLVTAPVTQAATAAPPTGSAYLLAGGVTTNVNGAAGNGVAGPRSVLDVPEPSSGMAFGFGLFLIGSMVGVRRRRFRDR